MRINVDKIIAENPNAKILNVSQGRRGMSQVDIVTSMAQSDLDHILSLYHAGDLRMLEELGRGSFGIVYGYKQYAIKYLKKESAMNSDVEVLKDIHTLECIPTLYAVVNDDLIIMEKIEGVTVRKYCENNEENPLGVDNQFIDVWENALYDVVKAGYSPADLHESNVMICAKTITPKIVDVGWFFKHDSNYDDFDIKSVRRDEGYSTAERFTGRALREYVYTQEHKKVSRDAAREKYIEYLKEVAM